MTEKTKQAAPARARKISLAAALIVAATVTVACSSSAGGSSNSSANDNAKPNLGTFTFVDGSPFGTQVVNAPFVVAQELGYWTEQGLTVKLEGLTGGAAAVQALIDGQGDASVQAVDTAAADAAEGKKQPVVSFFNFVHNTNYDIAVPASSSVTSLAQLKGMTIGVQAVTFDDASAAKTLLADAEGVPQSAIDELPIGQGASAMLALKEGKAAAFASSLTNVADITGLGLPMRNLPLPTNVAHASDTFLVTTPQYLATHKAQLTAFGRGLAEALTFCHYNVDACIDIYWKAYPTAAPANGFSDFQSAVTPNKDDLEARDPTVYRSDGKWGYQTNAAIAAAATVQNVTDITTAEIESLYTNALVAGMSDFNAAAIEQQAKDYKIGS